MLKTRVLPFEYETLKVLKAVGTDWPKQRILVALSGGRDSVALLNALASIKSRMNFEIAVAHVHHGKSSDKKVASFRKKSLVFASKLAKDLGLEFFLLEHLGAALESEADFRKAREALLESCRKENGFDKIAFAHHADDLLETRLIRLIRGTGAQGLKAMALNHRHKLRPFLNFSALQVQAYADRKQLKWLEDPTNKQDHFFRNWIRNTWLPMLEQKRAGSAQSLKRSLDQISESLILNSSQSAEPRLEVIKRKEFANLSMVEKREVVARVLLERGARDFSRRQIDEILKRLSSHRAINRRRMTFEVGGFEWRVNAERIEAVRL